MAKKIMPVFGCQKLIKVNRSESEIVNTMSCWNPLPLERVAVNAAHQLTCHGLRDAPYLQRPQSLCHLESDNDKAAVNGRGITLIYIQQLPH